MTITDLLLAALGGAWSEMQPAAHDVWVEVPVSLRDPGDKSSGNLVGEAFVDVPSQGDLLRILRVAHSNLFRAKEDELGRASHDLVLLRSHIPYLSRRPFGVRPKVLLSNVPGFPFQLYCERAPLCDALAMSRLNWGQWAKLTFLSFGDVLYGTLLEATGADGAGARFAEAFQENLDELCRMGESHKLLAQQPQFTALSPRHIDDLTRNATTVEFQPGEAMVTQGEDADAFYVIKSGSASVSVDRDERERLGTGAGFGEVGIFAGGTRAATVNATERVEALRIDESALRSVFGTDSVRAQPLKAIIDQYSRRSEDDVSTGL